MMTLRSARQALAAVLAAAPLAIMAACPEAQSAADRLQAAVSAGSLARDALVTIRRAAQDWKNLLLRGRDAAERQAMQDRLDAQARRYEAQLAQLRGQLTPPGLELDRLGKLDLERARIFEGYRSALARHGVASLEAAAAADREVQGADVATFRTLEQLIQTLTERTRAGFGDLRATLDRCGASASGSAP